MNCIVCNRDTGENGDHYAVYEDTSGNYGSQVLDCEPHPVRISICDWCLVERRDRLRLVLPAEKRCSTCGNEENLGFNKLDPVPDDVIPSSLSNPDYSGPPSSGSAGGASPNLHQP